jgi:hypothetical protein
MAIEEFWKNVSRTANWIGLRIESPPEWDREGIDANLRGANYWLKPGGVWGFDPGEFDFLSEEERSRLEEGVGEFKKAAESVPRRGMATAEQYKVGVAGFRKILKVVDPDKYRDFNAFVIGKKIEGLVGGLLPEWVKELTFEADHDSIGEPALHISVLAEDDALADAVLRENTRLVIADIADAASKVCPDRFPYFHFRTVSENERATRAGLK